MAALLPSMGMLPGESMSQYYPSSGGATGAPESGLASSVNDFMTDQAIAPFLKNLPGYAGAVAQRSQNTAAQLSGQLPQDVMQQIMQAGAERGVANGSPGSPNANAAMMRALGLNSLQMQQQGSQELSRSIADTPVPQLWNPMSLYVPERLGRQSLSAARAGASSAGRQPSYSGGGGYQMGGQVSGMGRTAAIPRYQAPAGVAMGGTGFMPQGNQSYNLQPWQFNDTSGGGGGYDQAYWDSAMGLQDPNRPADEEWINPDWMTPAQDTSWMDNPDWEFGSNVGTDYANQDFSYLE